MSRLICRLGSQAALIATACGALNSGCFVITSNHVSKPIGPRGTVELRHDDNSGEEWYVRHFHAPTLDFDVEVQNSTERLQMPFLFWVLPLPNPEDYVSQTFEVRTDFRPTSGTVEIDLWRIEYAPTNGISVTPNRILHPEEPHWKEISAGPISVEKPESFILEYEAPCDPDLPFQLRIIGVPASSDSNSVTTLTYKRAKFVHAGFRLPY